MKTKNETQRDPCTAGNEQRTGRTNSRRGRADVQRETTCSYDRQRGVGVIHASHQLRN